MVPGPWLATAGLLQVLGLLGAAHTLAAPRSVVGAHVPPPIEWAKGYTFGNAESHPHAGVETSDGGFLVVGDGVDYNNNTIVERYMMVLKTGKDGEEQWRRSYGDTGFNYGKFGIQLSDGTYIIAGALSEHAPDNEEPPVLKRALLWLDADGNTLTQLVMPNTGADQQMRDGFMCVAIGETNNTIVATGFVGGENSTTGYVDEPMFLINGGKVALTKFTLGVRKGGDGPQLDMVFDTVLPDAGEDFRAYQGMRLFYDDKLQTYAVSHTVSYDQGDNIQFGLSSVTTAGTVKWMKGYAAAQGGDLKGHASHPYALAKGNVGAYAIGGLAVIMDAKNIEQCQGRLLRVNPSTGDVEFDRRFTSSAPDTNIECYGLQATEDAGFVLTCGTGVEPELHPKDSKQMKTWMVLVHRTDPQGNQLWEKLYTTNKDLQNNAGEYIVATRDGGLAVYVDSQTYGSGATGGNFAILRLGGAGGLTEVQADSVDGDLWHRHRRHSAIK